MPAFVSHVVASLGGALQRLRGAAHGRFVRARRRPGRRRRRGDRGGSRDAHGDAPRVAVTRQQIAAIHNTHRVVILGLAGVIVSGVLLFAADVETYAASKLFWLKMVMVAVLMVNGAILVRVGRGVPEPDERTRRTMRWTAGLSLALWFLTTLAGAGLPNI